MSTKTAHVHQGNAHKAKMTEIIRNNAHKVSEKMTELIRGTQKQIFCCVSDHYQMIDLLI